MSGRTDISSYPSHYLCRWSSTHLVAVHTQDLKEIRPTIVVAGGPIVLVVGHIGSAMDHIDSELAPGTGTGSVGDREVAGVDQQDGSRLKRAVGYLCSRKTCKSLGFKVSSKREIVGEYTKSCSCERKVCKSLVVRWKKISLLCVILLHPARWQRTTVYKE